MAEGLKTLLYYYDDSEGILKMYEGSEPVSNLVTTDEISCATGGTTIATITAGKDGYVTLLRMYNTHTSAQEFTFADVGGTKITINIAAGETETWISDKYPLFVLDAGAITGTAVTANHIKVTMTYFERKA